VGEARGIAVAATDPDADTLEFRLIEGPEGAQIDTATGLITFAPVPGQEGDHVVLVGVSDAGVEVRRSAVFTVRSLPVTPQIRIETTPDFPAQPGQPVLIRPIVTAAAPVAAITVTIAGVNYTPDETGRVRFIPDAPGRVEIRATATDADGRSAEATHVLRVRDPSDMAAPVLALDPVPDGGVIRSAFALTGAIGDTNLDLWQVVLVDTAGRQPPRILAEGDSPASGVLAQVDPAQIADGYYTLRVVAQDMGGRRSQLDTLIEIAQPQKAGRLVQEYLEGRVDLGGFAFDILRRYDSLSAGTPLRGHIAPGWSIAGLDMRVEAATPVDARAALGLYAPLRAGDRVLARLPEGATAFWQADVNDPSETKQRIF
jgi:hypothetical protein